MPFNPLIFQTSNLTGGTAHEFADIQPQSTSSILTVMHIRGRMPGSDSGIILSFRLERAAFTTKLEDIERQE